MPDVQTTIEKDVPPIVHLEVARVDALLEVPREVDVLRLQGVMDALQVLHLLVRVPLVHSRHEVDLQ